MDSQATPERILQTGMAFWPFMIVSSIGREADEDLEPAVEPEDLR